MGLWGIGSSGAQQGEAEGPALHHGLRASSRLGAMGGSGTELGFSLSWQQSCQGSSTRGQRGQRLCEASKELLQLRSPGPGHHRLAEAEGGD